MSDSRGIAPANMGFWSMSRLLQITRTGIMLFFYRNKIIGSPGHLKFPTLASHYTIKVGCWARLQESFKQPLLPTIRSSLPRNRYSQPYAAPSPEPNGYRNKTIGKFSLTFWVESQSCSVSVLSDIPESLKHCLRTVNRLAPVFEFVIWNCLPFHMWFECGHCLCDGSFALVFWSETPIISMDCLAGP